MDVSFLTKNNGQTLAYCDHACAAQDKNTPSILFLGGFKSDMSGTKATALAQLCEARGQRFVRFDYSGHGQSSGTFEEGTISQWAEDALLILDQVIKGDVILVGSSMGGWIALLLAQIRPERIRGLVGIAAAPDFTREVESRMTTQQRETLEKTGAFHVPSDYSPEQSYTFTRALLEDGRHRCILDRTHTLPFPVILVQGKKDPDVPWQTALKIQSCLKTPKTEIHFIDDGDHRLSRPQDIEIIDSAIRTLTDACT